MAHLLARGDWLGALEFLLPVYEAGYRLTLLPGDEICGGKPDDAPDLVVLALGEEGCLLNTSCIGVDRATPWLCWNRSDDPARALAALNAGALAVLPAGLGGGTLLQSVRNALAVVVPARQPAASERRYARDEMIQLDRDAVLEVVAGVVAQAMIHDDGTEVLLGLCGPGQLLVGHPDDGCCLHLVAHTEVVVAVREWTEAAAQPRFAERLRARLRQMEAWSAAQARHYLDQRVLSILGLLAEQFGEPRADGVLIDVRITHAQLASAVGATRTTVTHILGELRGRELITTIGAGSGERFLLRTWERVDHGLR